jgi:hypothetical protein
MGFGGRLHSSNLEPLMSALGQKADIGARPINVRFTPKADIQVPVGYHP